MRLVHYPGPSLRSRSLLYKCSNILLSIQMQAAVLNSQRNMRRSTAAELERRLEELEKEAAEAAMPESGLAVAAHAEEGE